MEMVIGILGLIIIVLGFTTWNLLMKNEKAEDLINEQEKKRANLAKRKGDDGGGGGGGGKKAKKGDFKF